MYVGVKMQRPARSSRAEQAERDFSAHIAQVVDKEGAEWVLEAKQREVLDPLPAGAAADPMTQTKTDLHPLIIDPEKACETSIQAVQGGCYRAAHQAHHSSARPHECGLVR